MAYCALHFLHHQNPNRAKKPLSMGIGISLAMPASSPKSRMCGAALLMGLQNTKMCCHQQQQQRAESILPFGWIPNFLP
jgi:hypothetical protein